MRIFQQERVCFATAQGTVKDLEKNYDNKVMPLIGVDFKNEIEWNGVGKMPFDQFLKLKDVVKKSHDQGKKVRVYNCPDEENVWEVLLTGGVDFINCPNPERFSKFLASRP